MCLMCCSHAGACDVVEVGRGDQGPVVGARETPELVGYANKLDDPLLASVGVPRKTFLQTRFALKIFIKFMRVLP